MHEIYMVWHTEEMKQLASSNNPVTSSNKVVLRYYTPFSLSYHTIIYQQSSYDSGDHIHIIPLNINNQVMILTIIFINELIIYEFDMT